MNSMEESEMKRPYVALLSWTEKPIETMMYAFMNMHNPVPGSLEDFVRQELNKFGADKWSGIQKDFIKMLSLNPHCSVLEFVTMNWILKGVSRAFQQQLTRTRLAAYSIQSLRIVNPGEFAEEQSYHIPSNILLDEKSERAYNHAMASINQMYKTLLARDGVKTEDARGILPLNIFSPITMSINLRALSHMLEVRLCNLAQGEFQEVARQMKQQVCQHIDGILEILFQSPCERLKYCPMPINCGKTKYKLNPEYESINLDYWLKG